MSHSFIDPKKNYYNVDNDSDTPQKKIDPVAQAKWLSTPQVHGGWGLFNLPAGRQGNQPAQMFAQDKNTKNKNVDSVDFGSIDGNEMNQLSSNNSEASKESNVVDIIDSKDASKIGETKDAGEDDDIKKQIIIDGQLFNYYKTILMEADEVVIQISLEFAGEELTKTAENTLANMRAIGYKSGSNGLLYKTKIVSRQKWLNGELKWIKEGKNIGNKHFTTKGLELSTTKTTLKKQLGTALKEFGGAAVDLADMMICAEKGNVLDALPTALLVDVEVERINEIINDVSEKLLSEKILEGSASVSGFLRENYSLSKKYELIEVDSKTADGILNHSIMTYSQMLESIYNNTEERRYSVLFRKDSEDLNIRAVIENKS